LGSWVENLPLVDTIPGRISFSTLLRDTYEIYTKSGIKRNVDIAALLTIELLLKCDIARQLSDDPEGTELLKRIIIRLTNVLDKIKGLDRIQTIMKL
jgi:hypothetical protein